MTLLQHTLHVDHLLLCVQTGQVPATGLAHSVDEMERRLEPPDVQQQVALVSRRQKSIAARL